MKHAFHFSLQLLFQIIFTVGNIQQVICKQISTAPEDVGGIWHISLICDNSVTTQN